MIKKNYCRLAKSPIFIIAFVCMLIAFACNIAGIIGINEGNAIADVSVYGSKVPILFISTVIMTLAIIPEVLLVIGLVVFIIKARSESGGGLGAIKASQILYLIYSIFLSVLVSVTIGVTLLSVNLERERTLLWMALVLVIAVFVSLIIYYRCTIHAVSVAQKAIGENKHMGTPSIYIAIFNFMIGALNVIGAVIMIMVISGVLPNIPFLGSSKAVSPYMMLGYISAFAEGVAVFLYGIILVKARSIRVTGANYDDNALQGTNFCVFCGKRLTGSEECSCNQRQL